MSNSSFNKISEAIAESVTIIVDSRIENVKKLIQNVDGKHKLMLANRETELQGLQQHVEDMGEELKRLTGHELATVESLQKEVEDMGQKLLDIEQSTQALRQKLDKVTGLLKQQTEFRRSMRGVLD